MLTLDVAELPETTAVEPAPVELDREDALTSMQISLVIISTTVEC